MNVSVRASHAARGFSLVELLVAIVLAGIIFAAMVPFFATALKRTTGDNFRNVAMNIAQDRIEQVRLLGSTTTGYSSMSQTNLNYSPSPAANPFGDGGFGPTYSVTGDSVPYNVQYVVSPSASPQALQKVVTVTVTRTGLSKATTMSTIVKNPDPGVVSGTATAPSPSPTITGLSITVSFKDWNDVSVASGSGHGVTYTRIEYNSAGTQIGTFTSSRINPVSSASPTVKWTGLTGGTAFSYTVNCVGAHTTSTSPVFRLYKNARLKFDTNPGGT
jgi:prepilin-type N-terminal cleavage/methylation domain-containing protein